ncbi:hypothetical protein EX30DRAFT_373501 [Ascodesmis nigricans]|uniref:Uncharacterized protein n=1 Tax=Ascodesmis nigricans TaxID=341454 RepID=A0A4S2MNU5_9PEZI|nr:hypothetical protein EX30DRAFT_373501 [Ascodesmis nigricans]
MSPTPRRSNRNAARPTIKYASLSSPEAEGDGPSPQKSRGRRWSFDGEMPKKKGKGGRPKKGSTSEVAEKQVTAPGSAKPKKTKKASESSERKIELGEVLNDEEEVQEVPTPKPAKGTRGEKGKEPAKETVQQESENEDEVLTTPAKAGPSEKEEHGKPEMSAKKKGKPKMVEKPPKNAPTEPTELPTPQGAEQSESAVVRKNKKSPTPNPALKKRKRKSIVTDEVEQEQRASASSSKASDSEIEAQGQPESSANKSGADNNEPTATPSSQKIPTPKGPLSPVTTNRSSSEGLRPPKRPTSTTVEKGKASSISSTSSVLGKRASSNLFPPNDPSSAKKRRSISINDITHPLLSRPDGSIVNPQGHPEISLPKPALPPTRAIHTPTARALPMYLRSPQTVKHLLLSLLHHAHTYYTAALPKPGEPLWIAALNNPNIHETYMATDAWKKRIMAIVQEVRDSGVLEMTEEQMEDVIVSACAAVPIERWRESEVDIWGVDQCDPVEVVVADAVEGMVRVVCGCVMGGGEVREIVRQFGLQGEFGQESQTLRVVAEVQVAVPYKLSFELLKTVADFEISALYEISLELLKTVVEVWVAVPLHISPELLRIVAAVRIALPYPVAPELLRIVDEVQVAVPFHIVPGLLKAVTLGMVAVS